MKKNVYKILGLCLLMLTIVTTTNAQKGGGATVTINGPTNSSVGTTETYTITTSFGVNITAANWTVTGGTVVLSSNTTADVNWTSSGTHTIQYNVTASNYGALQDTHDVTVNFLLVLPPNVPSVTNITCTSAELVANGPIPSGQSWYWQGTNASGTSTSNPSTSNYIATANGTYYIKALESGTWSVAIGVQVTLSTPTWYEDADGDGLGDPNVSQTGCTQPTNYVSNSDDQCPNEHGGGSSTGCQVPVTLSNENYVYTVAPQIEVTSTSQLSANSDAIKNVTYLDGLGRPMQNVGIKQSATEKDIITHIDYDDYGRQEKEFLPYASTNNSGAYESTDPLGKTKAYYKTNYSDDFVNIPTVDINPYSQKELEASPLNRVFKQAAPGEDWKLGNGHEIEIEYSSNDANEVRLYRVSLSSTYVPTLTGGTSYYATGELAKMITKDENHTSGNDRTIEEFKNLQGQVILKRTYNNNQTHDTYYVYDDFGNLSFVLPPKSEANVDIPNSTEISELCYQYKYDGRNRLVEKKIPGKGKEFVIYDNLDRPVMTQDAKQATAREWLFTKYDKLGRVAYTGRYTHSSFVGQSSMQVIFDSNNNLPAELYESRVTSGTGIQGSYYENNDFPSSNIEVFTVNYYDDYNFNLAGSVPPAGINYIYAVSATPDRITTRTKALSTGRRVKILGQSKWITTISYYDHKARPIYVYSKNEYLNTTDVIQTDLDFTGKAIEITSIHTKTDNTQSTLTTIDMFTYDHVGRLLTQTQKINSKPIEVIASNTYDELGQMIIKRVGGLETDTNGLQTVDYSYNVRGWLNKINNDSNSSDNDLFNFTLRYNDPTTGMALYNGNISQTSWNTASVNNANNPVSNLYTYSYDALNRVTSGIDNTGNYNLTSVSYDKNGNITNLQRKGHTNALATSFGVMDNLTYTYDGNSNQLKKVLDNGADDYGFKDNADIAMEYTYDINGNMTSDANKGITSIVYNHLNLPTTVTIEGYAMTYTYDASGVKQSKLVHGVTTQYAKGYIYEKTQVGNPELQFMTHSEGYTKYENGDFDYVYQYKDHLGNIRLSYTDSNNDGSISVNSEIIEESSYYPFGLEHKGYNDITNANGNTTAQRFKYNGIELEEISGLYEMGLRLYDPSIARWNRIDPVTHYSASTYSAFDNNPIFWMDPSGADSETRSVADMINDAWNRSLDDGFAYSYDAEGNLTGVTKPLTTSSNEESEEENLQQSKAAKARDKYIRMVKWAREKGAHVAADNLEHWLKGSGKTKNLNTKWLRSFEAIVGAEEVNIRRFEVELEELARGLKDGQSAMLTTYWDRGLYAGTRTELYYASGGSTLKSRANLQISRKGNTIYVSGSITHNWIDRYNWDEGKSAYVPGFGKIDDDDGILVEKYYDAKSYDMRGKWTHNFKASGIITKGFFGASISIKLNRL